MRVWRLLILMLMGMNLTGCGQGSTLSNFTASGTIEATTVTLSAKLGGDVERILRAEGRSVSQGDTLLVIDAESYELQRNQVRAQIALADAQLRMAINGARAEDKRQAAQNVEAARINLKQAQSDKKRIADLVDKGSGTPKQLDDASSLVDLRQAQLAAMQQVLDKLLNGSREEEIDIARAQKAQAEASLALYEKYIRDGTVLAPLTGTITNILVEVGETVTPGQDLLSIADLQNVQLKIYVKEPQLPHLSINQDVQIRVDGRDEIFTGRVSYLADEAEFTPKTIQTEDERVKLVYAVKIDVPNPKGILKIGMPADAHFE